MYNLPTTSGIYLIECNQYQYIGQALNIRNRIKSHYKMLRAKKHRNKHLQNIFNKYGDIFTVTVLNECDSKDLNRYELEWLDYLQFLPSEYVINQCFKPNVTTGYRFTEEQKAYLSKIGKGKKKSDTAKRNISKATALRWKQGIMRGKPRKHTYIVSPLGVLYELTGISEFAKNHRLSVGNVSSLINGKIKQTKGYTAFFV